MQNLQLSSNVGYYSAQLFKRNRIKELTTGCGRPISYRAIILTRILVATNTPAECSSHREVQVKIAKEFSRSEKKCPSQVAVMRHEDSRHIIVKCSSQRRMSPPWFTAYLVKRTRSRMRQPNYSQLLEALLSCEAASHGTAPLPNDD